MKYLLRLVLPVFMALSFAASAGATDAKNDYLILGPGAYSCQRIIGDLARDAKDKNAASLVIYSNWLAGNLTAYNRGAKGTYSILGDSPFTEAFAWTVQYCNDHQDAIFASAADALITKLKPHRYATMPHKQEVDKPEKDDDDEEDDDKKDDKDDRDDK